MLTSRDLIHPEKSPATELIEFIPTTTPLAFDLKLYKQMPPDGSEYNPMTGVRVAFLCLIRMLIRINFSLL